MPHRLSRRSLVRAALAVPVAARMRQVRAESAPAPFAYPIGVPGETPGNGFLIRVGYACENLPSFPGWWHTGEYFGRSRPPVDAAPSSRYSVS